MGSLACTHKLKSDTEGRRAGGEKRTVCVWIACTVFLPLGCIPCWCDLIHGRGISVCGAEADWILAMSTIVLNHPVSDRGGIIELYVLQSVQSVLVWEKAERDTQSSDAAHKITT